QLRGAGRDVVFVLQGKKFSGRKTGIFDIRPDVPADYTRLFADLVEKKVQVGAIIYAWPLRPGESDVLRNAFYRLMFLVQSLPWALAGQLYVITAGAFQLEPKDEVSPMSATVLGTCKTLSYENPRWSCQHLDVGPADLAGDANRVAESLGGMINSSIS